MKTRLCCVVCVLLMAAVAQGTQDQEVKCGQVPIFDSNKKVQAQYRIIGGENAIPGEFPWQIALFLNGQQICGGSIIAPKWIATAAHCVRYTSGEYKIRAGEFNLKGPEGREQEIVVLRVEMHPQYVVATYDNDIAVLELTSPLNFTKYIQPICLPDPNEVPPRGKECHVTGWGKVKSGVPRSNVLQKIVLPVYDFATCKREYNKKIPSTGLNDHPRVNENMICVGYPEGGIDSCKGDSGGPMACKKNVGSQMVLYGITSWGIGCAGKFPGYYTRVGNYVQWINDIMSGKAEAHNKDPCSGGGVVYKGDMPVTIKSEGFDGESLYHSDSHCTWTIELPGSIAVHGAMIKFSDFDVEEDRTCEYDYVKVFSGENTELPLGKFCGNKIPTALRARGALKFKIVFHSDDSVNNKGFRAELVRFQQASLKDSNCGSLANIKTRRAKLFPETGVITSVQYPESYLSDTECIWTIRATRGHRVELTFEDTRLEVPNGNNNCSDSITIYDTKQAIEGREIGSSVCGTHNEQFSVVSTGRHMTIVFKADSEGEARGFKAAYKSVELNKSRPKLETPLALEASVRSNEDMNDSNDVCGIPFYEMSYDDERIGNSLLVEAEEITANSIPWAVHVKFCFKDPSSNESDKVICKTCDGTIIDKSWVVTVAHCFKAGVITHSLEVVLGDHDKDVSEDTEVTIDAERYIKYPNYNRSRLIMNDIALVELQQPVQTNKEIRPICLPSPDTCFSPGTVCISAGWGGPATYSSDTKRLHKAHVPLYSDNHCTEAVGDELQHPSVLCAGFIKGPNNPDQCGPEAGGGLMCRTSEDQPWFLYGIVSCGYGCLYPGCPSIYAKVSVLSEWITETIKRNITKPPMSKRDSCIAARKRQIEIDSKNDPCKNLVVLDSGEGEIESRNYPEPYDSNLNCQWTIKSPDIEKYVKITFEDFDVEGDISKCWDTVEVLDRNGEIIEQELCNEWKPVNPIFSLESATVRFKSDKSENFGGFKLKYETTDNTNMESNCGSEFILKDLGVIQSRGYPSAYPNSLQCQWLLRAKEGHFVELKFDSFDVEYYEGCSFDYVEIFDSDLSGHKLNSLGRICGSLNEIQRVYKSTTSSMLVKFKSDMSGSAAGFKASFHSVLFSDMNN